MREREEGRLAENILQHEREEVEVEGGTWLPNRSCCCLGDAWGDLNGFLRSRWSQESVKHPREYRRFAGGGDATPWSAK